MLLSCIHESLTEMCTFRRFLTMFRLPTSSRCRLLGNQTCKNDQFLQRIVAADFQQNIENQPLRNSIGGFTPFFNFGERALLTHLSKFRKNSIRNIWRPVSLEHFSINLGKLRLSSENFPVRSTHPSFSYPSQKSLTSKQI